jgi:hypothetical protein
MNSVSHLLGTEVAIRTTTGESFKGELFWYVYLLKFEFIRSYDIAESNSFVLQERLGTGKVNYHWIKCASVRDIVTTAVSHQNIETSSLPSVPLQTLDEQERISSENFSSVKELIGVGVTQEGQFLFNSLSKTMPCAWDGDVICCYGVRIRSPYSSENCDGPDDNELTRVKKVLEGEKSKLDRKRAHAKS